MLLCPRRSQEKIKALGLIPDVLLAAGVYVVQFDTSAFGAITSDSLLVNQRDCLDIVWSCIIKSSVNINFIVISV